MSASALALTATVCGVCGLQYAAVGSFYAACACLVTAAIKRARKGRLRRRLPFRGTVRVTTRQRLEQAPAADDAALGSDD